MEKSGLGQRGHDKVSLPANELFRKTDNADVSNNVNTHNSDNIEQEQNESVMVHRQYMLSFALSEKLRDQAFHERRKEVDIVREALTEYYERREKI